MSLVNTLDAVDSVIKAASNPILSSVWRKVSWVQLRVNGELLKVYLLYMIHRLRVFLTHQGFIFVVYILVLGIGYSAAFKLLGGYVTNRQWGPPLLTGIVVTLLPVVLKKYYLDKKVKRRQSKLETKLFLPLSARILVARTLSLVVRTIWQGRRKPGHDIFSAGAE